MPELPEVETVRRTLEQLIVGQRVTEIAVIYPKIVQTDRIRFQHDLINQTIHQVKRRGKHVIIIFDRDALIIHLRMEGRFFYHPQDTPLTKHDHLVFGLSSGYRLIYRDTRKFGTMHLYPLRDYMNLPPLACVGPEPNDVDMMNLVKQIQNKNTEIKAILLDQHIISGLGNIYVDETLFRAGIHPTRRGPSLSIEEIQKIVSMAQEVLHQATELGGTTIRTFEPMDGVHGRFQQELLVHTKEGHPCPVCQTPIIKLKVKGRGTYVCPNCQH